MSTAKKKSAKKKKIIRSARHTTGRGAIVSMPLGVLLLTFSLLGMFSLSPLIHSTLLDFVKRFLAGMAGPLYVLLDIWLGILGVRMIVSARHRVSYRNFFLLFLIFVDVLAIQVLVSQALRGGVAMPFIEYVGRYRLNSSYTYPGFLLVAYDLGTTGIGGWLGMLIAYPLWSNISTGLSITVLILALIVLLMALLRITPHDIGQKLKKLLPVLTSVKHAFSALFARIKTKIAAKAAQKPPKQAKKKQNPPKPPHQTQAAAMEYPAQPPVWSGYQSSTYVQPLETAGSMRLDDPLPPGAPMPATAYPFNQKVPYPQPVPAKPLQETVRWSSYQMPAEASETNHRVPYPAAVQKAMEKTPAKVSLQKSEEPPAVEKTIEPEQPVVYTIAQEQPVRQAPIAPPIRHEMPTPKPVEPEASVYRPDTPVYEPEVIVNKPDAKTIAPVFEPEQEETFQIPTPTEAEQMIHQQKQALDADDSDFEQVQTVSDWEEQPKDEPMDDEPVMPTPTEIEAVLHPEPEPKPVQTINVFSANPKATVSNATPQHLAKLTEEEVHTDPVVPITGERIAISSQENSIPMPPPKPKIVVPYVAPSMRLLHEAKHVSDLDARSEDEERAHVIERTLKEFNVPAAVREIKHGPAITQFAIEIAPGVKVEKVTNVEKNLALELKTPFVRIESPIPGTSYIGIEVPNKKVNPVSLLEVLDSEEMRSNTNPLVVALGKSISGQPILCNLEKMPHLLIAGSTGSGKSVCINSIICSLLYRTTPEQVRLILVDPKQVELNIYNDIPHLLMPVISEPNKAAGALAWAFTEMSQRYKLFAERQERNLEGYNKTLAESEEKLPRIVIIIDEMADLMEACRKDVEEYIRRLAALARAAGIYLVLATQRPSVDVITGVVKNNIPSRIAFKVSSGNDSRTILDTNGAEKLLGRGDMLYKPSGEGQPLRVQGCFVTDDEVRDITDDIRSRYPADYDGNLINAVESSKSSSEKNSAAPADTKSNNGRSDDTELIRQAAEMAVEDGQASVSNFQRRLSIGNPRAGRLLYELEKLGIVSAVDGLKPRKTLITREQLDEMFPKEE